MYRPQLNVFDAARIRVAQENWVWPETGRLSHVTRLKVLDRDGREIVSVSIHGHDGIVGADRTGAIAIDVDPGNTGTPLPLPSPEAPE